MVCFACFLRLPGLNILNIFIFSSTYNLNTEGFLNEVDRFWKKSLKIDSVRARPQMWQIIRAPWRQCLMGESGHKNPCDLRYSDWRRFGYQILRACAESFHSEKGHLTKEIRVRSCIFYMTRAQRIWGAEPFIKGVLIYTTALDTATLLRCLRKRRSWMRPRCYCKFESLM